MCCVRVGGGGGCRHRRHVSTFSGLFLDSEAFSGSLGGDGDCLSVVVVAKREWASSSAPWWGRGGYRRRPRVHLIRGLSIFLYSASIAKGGSVAYFIGRDAMGQGKSEKGYATLSFSFFFHTLTRSGGIVSVQLWWQTRHSIGTILSLICPPNVSKLQQFGHARDGIASSILFN